MLEMGSHCTVIFHKGAKSGKFIFSQGEVFHGVCLANMKILVLGTATRCQMVPRYQLLIIDGLYHLEPRASSVLSMWPCSSS